jgi:rhamnogalacturonan endolyase
VVIKIVKIKKGILCLLAAVFIICADCRGDVTLVKTGSDAILDNGIIRAVIDTNIAQVKSLKYKGFEMVSQSGGKNIYFSMTTRAGYDKPGRCVYSVTSQSSEFVDISCKKIFKISDLHAWDVDIHYVLQKGISGLYVYAIVSHPADYPDVSMNEWRMVWWLGHDDNNFLLDKIFIDELRNWQMASFYDEKNAEHTGIKEIIKYKTGVRAGRYDCKYMYSADLWKLDTYGFAGSKNNIGAWVVFGSHEFFNDGPTKNDLTAAAGIIHIYLNANHYGGSGFKIEKGQAWSKIYGPWLLYFNNKDNPDDCWADAKAAAQIEKQQWPYKWLKANEYQSDNRGAVTGTFIVKDKLKPDVSGAGAWVGLALPEKTNGNWQYQGKDYQYWTKADSNDNFTIENVRPGNYTLYAFTNGAVGESRFNGITVRAKKTTSLGKLVWKVPHKGRKIAWEIGVPDRTAAEFKHGSKDYYEPYLFETFAAEFVNPLEYYVSKNNWSTDLNYAHNPYIKGQMWKWRINFVLDKAPSGDSTLTLAIAGSQGANLYIYVNDESKELTSFRPDNSGGNALLREGIHAKYALHYVTIPAGKLKAGLNTITLAQASTRGPGNHIMYDYINLELPN